MLFILLLFCWIRAALPRYRWDQLLVLAWRTYLPLVLLGVLFIIFFFNFFSIFESNSEFFMLPLIAYLPSNLTLLFARYADKDREAENQRHRETYEQTERHHQENKKNDKE